MKMIKPVKVKVADNKQLPCSVHGCTNHRTGLSKYCHLHKTKAQKYGSPEGVSLYTDGGARVYAGILKAVHEVLISHTGSEPVQAALKVLTDWIEATKAGSNVPGSRLIQRFEPKDETYLYILQEVTAAFIHIRLRTGFSDQEVRYAMGNAVYRLVPKEWRVLISSVTDRKYRKSTTKINPKEREEIGQHVLELLGPFLMNVLEYYKQLREIQRDEKLAMAKPI
ncbi:MAG: hypothetical protein ABW085_16830 [Sedimenticola sp.]